MTPDEKARTGARSGLLPQLARHRLVLPGVALIAWALTYGHLALSEWNPALSFVKIIALGDVVFVWALGLYGWLECHYPVMEVEPGRFVSRAETYSPERYWFSLSFFASYAAAALAAAVLCMAVAFG